MLDLLPALILVATIYSTTADFANSTKTIELCPDLKPRKFEFKINNENIRDALTLATKSE